MKKLLEVNNLSISFHTYGGEVQAVRDVNFDLHEGETLAIVGESGSGKSVTVQSVMRLISMPPGEFKSRSEEHTSELQSRGHLVCRLLLEKKKKKMSHQI